MYIYDAIRIYSANFMDYNLRTWNADIFKASKKNKVKHFYGLIVGPPKMGKSSLIKYLYKTYWKKVYDLTVVFSMTLNNGFYEGFIVGKMLFDRYDRKVIENMQLVQQQRLEQNKKPLN